MTASRGLVALVACVCMAAAGLPAQAQQADDDGLDLSVSAQYAMRPAQRVVEVTLDAVAANTLSDAEDEFGVTRFFFDELVFALPVEAEDVVASDEGGELAVVTTDRPGDGISEAAVQLRSRLYSGQTRSISVKFRLPATPPRSSGDIRVDRAYGWFFLWAYGDPGKSTVSASIPAGYDVNVIGDPLRRTASDTDDRRLVSGEIEDPLAWVAVISARNDAALVSTAFELEGTEVVLRSWPSDPEWAAGVEDVLRTGIPAMAENVGRAWSTDVLITESIEPSIHGFGGWYVDSLDSIELGEDLDSHLVLHEMSHAWFNDGLFTNRWITEGLADVFADAAVEEIGEERWEPEPVDPSGPGHVALNDWAEPSGTQQPSEAVEAFGYAASWTVLAEIVDEIGFERMRAVLDAAWTDTIAYQGDTDLDLVEPRDDWRRFLDLLEEVGGSTGASALFDTWVVSPGDRGLLEERARTRLRYAELEAAAGEWALPPELRRAMGEWRFDDATTAIVDASRVVVERDRLRAVADDAGVVPLSLEGRFEAGEKADVLIAEMQAQEAVATNIIDAAAAAAAPRSLFESMGLIGAAVERNLGQARLAFSDDRLADARELAVSVSDRVHDAESAGRLRAGVGSIVLLIAATGALVVRRRRRRTLVRESS